MKRFYSNRLHSAQLHCMPTNPTDPNPIKISTTDTAKTNPISTIISELTAEINTARCEALEPSTPISPSVEGTCKVNYTLDELKYICNTHLLQEYEKLQILLKSSSSSKRNIIFAILTQRCPIKGKPLPLNLKQPL